MKPAPCMPMNRSVSRIIFMSSYRLPSNAVSTSSTSYRSLRLHVIWCCCYDHCACLSALRASMVLSVTWRTVRTSHPFATDVLHLAREQQTRSTRGIARSRGSCQDKLTAGHRMSGWMLRCDSRAYMHDSACSVPVTSGRVSALSNQVVTDFHGNFQTPCWRHLMAAIMSPSFLTARLAGCGRTANTTRGKGPPECHVPAGMLARGLGAG